MNVTEELLHFAELAARTGLEPGFEQRAAGTTVSVESLSTADTAVAEWCFCYSVLLDTRVGA
ncbi:hypothetical protein ACFYOV_01935 [Streptomyces sp. NPDC005931]|uniref:hypothetical protein n=1 Tax=Streptomyces sp. NPDC005931 TaxID=3364737 RepID=UPI0036A6AAB8